MRVLRLTDPALDFWIDVCIREFDGRWLAVVADLAGAPEVGVGGSASEALAGALAAFGPALAQQLATRANLLDSL